MTDWDAAKTAAFYDEYGAREWTRFEVGAGMLAGPDPDEPELREWLTELAVDLAADDGALSCGEHLLGVVRRP